LDDVRLSITQFSFFVDAPAEKLRSSFVAHEGKKELIVSAMGSQYSDNFGSMERRMGR